MIYVTKDPNENRVISVILLSIKSSYSGRLGRDIECNESLCDKE